MLIQAKCPGCGTVLRIPSEWVNRSVRCKQCGTVVRAEKKSAAVSSTSASAKGSGARAGRRKFEESQADRFDFAAIPAPPKRRSPASRRNVLVAVGGAAVLAVIGIAVYFLTPPPPRGETAAGGPGAALNSEGRPSLPVATGPFPRRLLAVQVCNYLYFDPLGYGAKPYDGRALVERLAQFFHVQPTQVAELSDAAPGNLARPPMKRVIEKTVRDFLNASRRQDRVVLLFAGHLIEVEDQPFLVPMEGEGTDKNTLIPLAWVYDELQKCPARQKVLILDVCRFDPSQGTIRQGGGPMGEKTFALLKSPPPGVQVWSACSAGQVSHEDGVVLHGSVFLTKMGEALSPGKEAGRAGIQQPQDPLPLQTLGNSVNAATQREVEIIYREQQTPVLSGQESAAADVAYDPNEPFPPKLVIDAPQGKDFKPANPKLIQDILKEAADIPPVKVAPSGTPSLRADFFPVFSETVMKEYQPDNASTPFRDTVRRATAVLKKHAKTFPDVFRGDVNSLKQRVANDQRGLANATLELNEALEMLEAAGKKRDQEHSKRWQAYYDYVHARLLERIAYTFEYNYMLAAIRTDSLPPRDPKQHSGWRLASREKMQAKGDEGKQAKKYADDAKKILLKMAEEHRGTPYEVLAKRDAMNALGLEWKPTR